MLRNVFFAAIAAGLVAAVALPVQITPACKEAAKAKFPKSLKERNAYRKACRKAWKAAQK